MISPDEIKEYALKWWKAFLQSEVTGEQFFPKVIDRIGKVKSGHITERFEALQQEIELLYRHSKERIGNGYRIVTAERNFRRTGSHALPDSVVFESAEDYVAFIGKKKEWKLFLVNSKKLQSSIPDLHEWVINNCLSLTIVSTNWDDILKVCHYFKGTPRPDLYLRQLPIQIHTKFIEENSILIQSLVDFLIPDHVRDLTQRRFAERYFLRYDQPLIRLRFLDRALCLNGSLSDISIPLSDFNQLDVQAGNVLITENKMNFLTLPPLASTVAAWSGGGFNISYLKDASWLSDKRIFYWGDIDEHGFQILHQLRSYYPFAESVMMDIATYKEFENLACGGARNKAERLALLTEEESELFRLLKASEDRNRLEQEKIPQWYVEECLGRKLTALIS